VYLFLNTLKNIWYKIAKKRIEEIYFRIFNKQIMRKSRHFNCACRSGKAWFFLGHVWSSETHLFHYPPSPLWYCRYCPFHSGIDHSTLGILGNPRVSDVTPSSTDFEPILVVTAVVSFVGVSLSLGSGVILLTGWREKWLSLC